ncbi:MAG: tRNA glutamyl-Q(34) synthetase GluQRS, partial [Alcaligenes sp.]
YLHVPLILDAASGLKLSKQNGAAAIDLDTPTAALAALAGAWRALGFNPVAAPDRTDFLRTATAQWARRFPLS